MNNVVPISGALVAIQRALKALDSDAVRLQAIEILLPLERSGVIKAITTFDGRVVGWRLLAPIPGQILPLLRELAEIVNKPVGRAPKDASRMTPVEIHATPCFVTLRSNVTNVDDMDVRMETFERALEEYPEDVIASAFMKIVLTEEFVPQPVRVREICTRECRWRRSLQQLVDSEPPPPRKKQERPPAPTPAEIESVRVVLDRTLGRRPTPSPQTTPAVDTADQTRHRFEARIQNYAITHFVQPELGEILEVLWGLRGEKTKTAMLKKLNKKLRAEHWKDQSAEADALQQVKTP